MIVFTMAYIATVSPVAMLLCLGLIGGGTAVYLKDHAGYGRAA